MDRRMEPRRVAAAACAVALSVAVLVPVVSFAETPDVGNTPETARVVPPTYSATGSVDPTGTPADTDDVYKVWLTAGKRFEARTLGGTAGVDVDLFFMSAAATYAPAPLRYSASEDSVEQFTYDVKKSGWFFIDVWAYNGSTPEFPTPSAAGDYYLRFRQFPVPYKLVSFTLPTTARAYAYFTTSVQTYPTYLRTGKPVTFVIQKRTSTGSYVTKYSYAVSGVNIAGNKTRFSKRLSLGKGTYRCQARFKDVDHALMTTGWKYIKVSY